MPTVRTVTVKSAGGDYSSLIAAEAGEQDHLVSLDRQLDVECYAFDDINSSRLLVDGWTTDATRYIRIFTPAAERHNGKWDTAAYRWRMTSGWGGTFFGFTVSELYTRIDGLQISAEIDSGSNRMAFDCVGGCRVSNNIIRVVPNVGNSHVGASIGHTEDHGRAWNNIIYQESLTTGSVGLTKGTSNFDFNGYLYSNTVHGWATGISGVSGNAVIAKNNLCNGNTADYGGSYDAASANNLSEDATSPNAALRNKAVTFVDEGNYDFHLASGDTNAKDAGADLSADANLAFSTDIDGQTRSGTWDIGADEFASAGQTVTVGLVSETDSALAATARKTLAAGLVTETDSALTCTARKALTVGLAIETETALPCTPRKTKALGLALESDSAFGLTIRKALTVGLAIETDEALPLIPPPSGNVAAFPGLVTVERKGALVTIERKGGACTLERMGSLATHKRKTQ